MMHGMHGIAGTIAKGQHYMPTNQYHHSVDQLQFKGVSLLVHLSAPMDVLLTSTLYLSSRSRYYLEKSVPVRGKYGT